MKLKSFRQMLAEATLLESHWTEKEHNEFYEWYDKFNLGWLEPVRATACIDQYAMDNASDARTGEKVDVAKATVQNYIDDKESARELFGDALQRANIK